MSKLRLPKIDVARVKLSDQTITLIGKALRHYVTERLRSQYFEERDKDQVEQELKNRRHAFNILSVFDLEPRYDVVYMLAATSYNNKPEVRINSIRLPDGHYPILIDAVNEELLEQHELQGLVCLEEAERVAVHDENIQCLLKFLTKMGVDVSDDYMTQLTKV